MTYTIFYIDFNMFLRVDSLKRSCPISSFIGSRGEKKAVFFPPWQFWFLIGTKHRVNNLKICSNIFDFGGIFSQIFHDVKVSTKKFVVQWKKVLRAFLTTSRMKKLIVWKNVIQDVCKLTLQEPKRLVGTCNKIWTFWK